MSQSPGSLDGLRIKREDKPDARYGILPVAVVVGILALIAAAVFWFSRPSEIEVQTVVAREVPGGSDHIVLNASGYVTARREATVSSKVTGKVTEILIEEGMTVTENQVLARLDATNVTASLQLAQAQLSAAKAALAETQVRVKEARQELQRQTDLRKGNVSAQSDYDHAEAAALALEARLEQQAAEAGVADRTVSVWQQQLDDTIIRAPFAGTVTSKNAQPGEMISPMSTGGFTRTGICTIVDMQSLEIEIDVNESYINRVEAGQAVEATLDAYPDWKIPCHVIAIIPTADRNKSTVRVRVGFDKLDPRILPDMSVKVAFRETKATENLARRGVVVPKSAIIKEADRSIVLVVSRRGAERRAVSISEINGDDAVLGTGVAGGERVVINPPKDLKEGARVKETTP